MSARFLSAVDVAAELGVSRRRAHLTLPDHRNGARPGGVWGKVYFLEAVGAGRIKIGWTTGDVAARIEQFFCGCPFELRCLGWIWTLRQSERMVHRHFAHLLAKKNSEWFLDAPELRAFIAERCSQRSRRSA